MARSINQVNLMGRLTRDVDMRTTTTGKTIAQFSIAVDRGGKDEATDFFDVTAWEKLAEIVNQYTQKGSKVYVTGRLQLDRWETDGERKSKVTVVANDVIFLDSPKDSSSNRPLTQNEVLEKAGVVSKDTVIEDIDDKPIDLSEIPF